ncbi:uncharacterized 2Fe-2S/4Fe-4S cluster protein (DUF4445 family) [Mobilisporobacter senegalensis]|uniref:Uncharacterized 2Fe-2S/4Fe-4S cluster protein (DUF4445 family) n=1 Tax=Mobilisporobacter senegalensis TaxID=1329262 RepID=A0A3N1XF27_9FIRM|nr:ASKHA domain-containing protein [Mobilisporobacter senegalensis]ROR25275.1 uncharacterized 2Fe-2S/4Fe-4S cluster protein (DUF4445 family) [Mobilisporobacter senegalensis]
MEVQFLPVNKKIKVEPGTSLLQAAIDSAIDVNAVCGGNGTCGKCKMLVTKGNIKDYDEIEKQSLTNEELNKGMRLSCRMKIESNCCVIVPEETRKRTTVTKQKKIELDKLSNYGVSIDIGTTSVEACLFDLDKQYSLIQIARNNPQRAYGADVISRISYCNQSVEHLNNLHRLIRECCNELIHDLLAGCGILNEDNLKSNKIEDVNLRNLIYNKIKKCVILGNTTMSHIFLGKSLKGLAKVPFEEINYDIQYLSNDEKQFHMSLEGEIIVLPGIYGHVGSDTLGCILATDFEKQKGINLIIDIGTNGEMVISKDGTMICCSTAAGPAFEGASIYQGMRAMDGAIKGVYIDKQDIRLDVIGEINPSGICGSGIIDAIAELIKEGIIDETGRILTSEETDSSLASRIVNENGMKFILGHSKDGRNIVLTQQDIREVQLAKAAINAGTISLLEAAGVESKDINNIYIAGAFGSNINIDNAIVLGLLPDINRRKFRLIGNGALNGGVTILSGEKTIEEVTIISNKVKHIELANDDGFQKRYIDGINFSHQTSSTAGF